MAVASCVRRRGKNVIMQDDDFIRQNECNLFHDKSFSLSLFRSLLSISLQKRYENEKVKKRMKFN